MMMNLDNPFARLLQDEQYPPTSRVAVSGRTQSGVRMDADRMLRVSACWAATRFLSQTIARLPWRVKRETDRGSEVQRYHPVDYLLSSRVSAEWSAFQFKETMVHWALRWGNGFAEIERNVGGRPIGLWPIHPSHVLVCRDTDNGELFYRVYGNGGAVDIPASDMFHLRGLGEGPVGLNVMAYAAESIGWVMAAQVFGASFFRNSANPSGVVTMKRTLTPEGMAELRKDFIRLYSGAAGANKIVFLDNEMEFAPISVEPEKSQFVETNQYLLDEVCRWFGVPPHKIYNLLRATFSNIEHQTIEVVDDSIAPWAQRLEDEADFKLLGANRAGLWTEIDLRSALRADTATRMAYYQGLRNIGGLNVNEIREMEGLNAIGPDGDKYTLQTSMTTLDRIGEVVETPAPAPQAPPMEKEEPDPAHEMKPDPEMMRTMLETLLPHMIATGQLQGLRGERGPQGEAGPAGPAGRDGIDGRDGERGPQGEAGPAGPAGERGPQGEAGPAGRDGVDGINGRDGEAGPAGRDGIDGRDGERGPQGEAGPAGPAGERGPQGEAGPAGPAGRDGIDGRDGERGPAGRDGRDAPLQAVAAPVLTWQDRAEPMLRMGVSVRKVAGLVEQPYSVVYRWWKGIKDAK